MRTRFALMLGVLGVGVTGCDGERTGPASRALAPTFQVVDFDLETHFRCYIVSQQTPDTAVEVILADQFNTDTLTLDEPLQFCAPTEKNGLPILEPDEHLTMYAANRDLTPHLNVEIENQFGADTLEVVGARMVLVPTQKQVGGLLFPELLNHSWCYEVTGDRLQQTVTLDDQFGTDTVRVERPHFFCNPVEKTTALGTTPILEPDVHLTCYEIFAPQRVGQIDVPPFGVLNQIEQDTFTITTFQLLCVPTEKGIVTPA